jgi:hypothetical protein
MTAIVSDNDVFQQFTNDKSRKQYQRTWSQFVDFCGDFDFDAGQPGEELLSNYFKFLRLERKMASSSLWTVYSCLNSIFKRKYNAKLQDLPRLTLLIKGFNDDVKQKAAIFDDAVLKEFMLSRRNNAYWLVRQAICIVSFFGGLHYQECMDLELEKIQRSSTAAQMTDFFGWKNPSMCHEYVSSSKPAITKMAQTLAAYPENFNMEDPDVELEVEVEVAEDSEKNAKEELCEDFMFAMEEDPEMYVAAGLPPPCAPPHVKRLGLRCHCQSCHEFCRRDERRECEHQSRCCEWEF